MGNIVLLDELTINQIAAGEVIERPASVIKEMVENSIDAGSKNIVIEIKNGGISYIRITDDGKGIMQDDLEIAFERHATSKIRVAEDLDKVTSMGFRGEALASIASIANVELNSKTEIQDNGYKIVIEGGEIIEKDVSACRKGTTITVKNLFYNTPVRYKFLKKDYTESGYIEDVITRLALVNPHISFKLINTGKTIIQTNGSGELKDIVYAIFGKEVASALIPVNSTYEDIKVEGVIGKPEIARSNRAKQLYFVNKRFIKDKSVGAAIEQGYKGMIPIGKFGFVVLNMTLNPAKVDVNVHPAKTEVRFEEEQKVFQAIYHSIKDSLLNTELVENTSKTEKTEVKQEVDIPLKTNARSVSFEERLRLLRENKKEESATKTGGLFSGRNNEADIEKYIQAGETITANNEVVETNAENASEAKLEYKYATDTVMNTQDVLAKLKEMNEQIKEEQKDIINHDKQQEEEQVRELEKEHVLKSEEQQYAMETKEEKEEKEEMQLEAENEYKEELNNEEVREKEIETKVEAPVSFEEMYEKMFGNKIEEQLANKAKGEFVPSAEDETVFEEVHRKKYKIVGAVFNTYIILEIEDTMYILDQHAAHERVLYEQVKDNYFNMKNETQLLLLPEVITLTHKEMGIVKENWSMFENAGFDMYEFGENTIKLSGVPTMCLDLDNKELFLETLDQINSVARTSKQEKEERFIATVACKAAVKGRMILNIQEMEVLLNDLLKLPNPFTCPHGRPTAIKMDKYNIERKFARK